MKRSVLILLVCITLLSAAAAEELSIPGSLGNIVGVLKTPEAELAFLRESP